MAHSHCAPEGSTPSLVPPRSASYAKLRPITTLRLSLKRVNQDATAVAVNYSRRVEILDVASPRRRHKGDAPGLTFVRKAFGKGASPITVAQVKAAR